VPFRPPALIVSGAVATGVIALASVVAHRPALTAALGGLESVERLPAPLWLIVLATLLATYSVGLGLGWVLWGRRA
jgi:hypothetical protein